ncbi:hypothetical protein HK405_013106, partial [Cladochytrium tenue]
MDGLRRRDVRSGSGSYGPTPDSPSATERVLKTLRNFDAYAKPLDDFRVKTSSGAAVSLISYALILVLLLSEFADWQTVQVIPSLDVDKARKEKMWINLNITFPKVPCYLLSIDVMDVSGDHQNDVDHSIHKARIDPNGVPIAVAPGVIGEKADESAIAAQDPSYCGSCYGGIEPEGGCCNSCEDVRKAYTAKGWSFKNADEIEQ